VYAPYYCDVSIRPGWFWHPEENNQLKTLSQVRLSTIRTVVAAYVDLILVVVLKLSAQLVDIYFGSVGNNCMLQLNVPPNTDGLLEDGETCLLLLTPAGLLVLSWFPCVLCCSLCTGGVV
jgi:alpha-L-fucosidase